VGIDEASKMSGSLSGIQGRFKKKNEKSLFDHCYMDIVI